jgi:hypothetical protein
MGFKKYTYTPLLGNDNEASNYTTAALGQQQNNNRQQKNSERCFLAEQECSWGK